MRRFLLLLVPWVLLVAPAGAQDLHFPEKGSELRASILDAARSTFEKETGGPIEFVISRLAVLDEWAYGEVKLQRPGGKPIDWSKTKFAEDEKEGMFDPAQSLFLLQEGGDGWTLVEFAVGPTDVAWDWWRQQHNIPKSLFSDSD
jgi:hypothetical protein